MSKKFIKRVVQLGGFDIRVYNKNITQWKSLYRKYKDFTMVPEEAFISNLELSNKFINVGGDIVECGVWRGGMIAAISEQAGKDRRVHLFDSFEGLPPAKEIDGKEALEWQANIKSPNYFDNCSAEESFVREALGLAGHDNFEIYKGWFNNTVSTYRGNEIAILRLDGDWYDSVKECLVGLFPRVKEGGIVIIDDYYIWDGCSKAVHDYLSSIRSPSRIHQWNNEVAYIIKKN